MNNGFLILILIIAILAFSGRIQGLSGLLIFGLILFFLGWFTVKFFWIILAIVGINYITKSMRPKTHRRTQYTYRTYTQQDFEDFFEEPLGVSMEDNIKGVLREIMGILMRHIQKI